MANLLQYLRTEEKMEEMYRSRTQAEGNWKEKGENIIPRHFTLKSKHNNMYLTYIRKDEGRIGSFLRFSGERMISPYTKFELEYTSVKKEYVHIRSSYNNKFWVRESSSSTYIVAAANDVDEDVSKWTCTLFEVIYNDKENAYSFRHVELNSFVYLSDSSDQFANCFVVKSSSDEVHSLFTVTDLDAIFILPRHVAFKGGNEKYLKYDDPYLQFSASNATDSSASHEIIPTKDGNVHIRSEDSGKFWTLDSDDDNWIKATSSKASEDNRNTLFWPVKVNNSTMALRCLGKNLFCTRLTGYGHTNCLNSNRPGIVSVAEMEVEEVAISRTIDSIKYRLDEARIYGLKVISMAKGEAVNKTNETDTVTFKFSYEDKKKSNWTSSISGKVGLKVTFEADLPIIKNSKIEVSGEYGHKREWGETTKKKEVIEKSYTVSVPPNSTVKINITVKQGKCQVPFSYRRTEILTSGKRVEHYLNDGLFTGVSSYDTEFSSE